jgi:hypothetical protein
VVPTYPKNIATFSRLLEKRSVRGTIATFSRFKSETPVGYFGGPTMPFGKYFLFAGTALLSLLYLVDWYVPRSAAEPAHSEVARSIVRIHSEHQWPKAVAFDTNVKTINPPIRDDFQPSPVDSNRSQDKSQNEALAYAPARLPQSSKSPKPKLVKSRLANPPMQGVRRKVVSEQTQSAPFWQSEW